MKLLLDIHMDTCTKILCQSTYVCIDNLEGQSRLGDYLWDRDGDRNGNMEGGTLLFCVRLNKFNLLKR